jgi:hypothetical protein
MRKYYKFHTSHSLLCTLWRCSFDFDMVMEFKRQETASSWRFGLQSPDFCDGDLSSQMFGCGD